MIKALRKKSTIISAAIICALIVVFFVTSIILEQIYIIELPYNIPVVLVFILVILILIAFVVGDTSATRYRKKNKLWAGALPEEVKQRVWDLITPCLIAIVVTVIIAVLDSLLWRL